MSVFRVIIACILLSAAAHAQDNKPHPAAKSSVAEKYGTTITNAALKKQLYIIAGPEMEGRETATRGQERAAAYIAGQFREIGLQPGVQGKWEQHYPLYSDSLKQGTMTVRGKTFEYGDGFIADLRTSHEDDIATAKVVFAGYGIVADGRDDYRNLDASNGVVLIREGTVPGIAADKSRLIDKIKVAKEKGARALLVITPAVDRYRALDQRQLRKTGTYLERDTIVRALNVYFVSPAMAAVILGIGESDSLLADIHSGKRKPAMIDTGIHILFRKEFMTLRPCNVLGYLEGSDKKDEIVFITAHFDHLGQRGDKIFYGADDDGSGTSAVISIAAAFAQAKREGHGPRRSMVFMTVSGEEKGLLGSKYYTSHPVYPLAQTVVDLNIDMIGRIDPAHEKDTNYVYIIGDNKLSSELRPINEKANDTYTGLQLDYKYNSPDDPEAFYYRSDHYMFAQHNIPIIFYFNGTHADYHQHTDTVDKINFDLLTRRAQLVFYTAWDIANRELRPVVDRHEE
ncbi:M28 family peptidase [Chitinophaga nivalis]|uniref:M28 family peptidase n=1 Tax=Chitinophaga nivalis TaxID=2991709 RepID=A0ABT3IW43_9BACT|nr:M28 family peptidase [Chitinophaga nivalis]MCW3462149.1 M28 family peptidase [Chitinophaga nivalis]MCW3488159.1 M28 family peptidase [Chitinophaga nivalis]